MSLSLFPKDVPLSKRLFDVLLTLPALIIIAPLLVLLACCIWLIEGRPVFFRQTRPGLHGEMFTIIKFRTMREKFDAQGKLLPDGQRISKLGQFLRSTSLDELPEFMNVLRGEMSLVGPRPLLAAYLPRYSKEQARRHEVLPGITGWAQVNGRNILTWEEKFRLDVWYVDNRSIWLDIKILFLSLWKMFKREGISQPGHATAEEFMGSAQNSSQSDT